MPVLAGGQVGPDHTPGWGGRERSLHRSPKELFSPCLYLEAQLLCSEGGPLEQGAGMSQCSDSHTPGGCLLPWPPAAALSPGSPVSLFLVVGGSLGPVSAWKLWVSQGTLSSPLVLDEPLGPPSWPDPHPASLCNASHPPTPLPSPHSGRLFVDTPGQCGKGASASLLAALPGQSCLARWGLCVAPTISRGKPWMPAPGAGGIGGTRPVTVSGVREAIRRVKDAGGGATRQPGGCLAVSGGGCWLGRAASFWASRRDGGSGAAVCPQPGQTSFLAAHSPCLV